MEREGILERQVELEEEMKQVFVRWPRATDVVRARTPTVSSGIGGSDLDPWMRRNEPPVRVCSVPGTGCGRRRRGRDHTRGAPLDTERVRQVGPGGVLGHAVQGSVRVREARTL